ncbi:hypothetical protein [Streptomyces sp. NPDC049949]|uniref:hypothetical protein n=1 Tax=Streptomyces sp. NPDC049949 TaxID=3154627 RepID=UPI00341532A9
MGQVFAWIEYHVSVIRFGTDGVPSVAARRLVAARFRRHESPCRSAPLHDHLLCAVRGAPHS